ncbi:conserved hypothetical protein [Perkinsus marinus ATCC 50983]|uniref:WD repeat domain phosphoinositide-interacting protein n=1 Tax=Perkinsus marinus (strain ATCC 50983 / TXsc) TaxID=423536 RepID=C5LKR9_PERM5|nr:conserved hypothetical protein [Perkinsus marinus ATCC 50983]EER02673.1 conserved hypothetical protein [Perkinsus marinus ATCC 50983]|eukprot:XP_002769976.1 conserved hypothetical protein [Perkinsus marinus ATCC 50983]
MDLSVNHLNDLLYLTVNQDQTCFVVGTEDGFRVYSVDPFKPAFSRRFRDVITTENESNLEEPRSDESVVCRRSDIADANGGIGIVEMLYRCNILALVGGGRNPRFAPHKVILWDDRYPRPLAELSFRTTVKAVRMRRDMIVVAIDSKVGIIALNQSESRAVLATVADQQKGKVICTHAQDSIFRLIGRVRISAYDMPLTAESRGPSISSVILAHDSQISQLALDSSGNLLATSSDKGTLIRIHDTTTGYLLQELRRGVDRADICSIVFHPSGRWIVVSSDKGTVHVFAVRLPSGGGRESRGGGGNARSKFRFFGGYFGSEWSFARFRVPDYRCIACFGSTTNTVAVMCADGSYYKAKFDPVFGGFHPSDMKNLIYDY